MAPISTRRLRALFSIVFTIIVARYTIKLFRLFQKWSMITKKALDLPTLERPDNAKLSLDFMGTLKRSMPKGEVVSPENISKYFVKAFYKIATENKGKHGLVTFWFLNPAVIPIPMYQVILLDYELIKQLCSSKMNSSLKKSQTYVFLQDLIGKSLVVESGKVWHDQRVVMDKGFLKNQLERYPGIIEECCSNFNTWLKSNLDKPLDTTDLMLKLIMDVLGKVVFSKDFKCVKDIESDEAYVFRAFEGISETLRYWVRSPVSYLTRNLPFAHKHYWNCVQGLDSYVKGIIEERKIKIISDPEFKPIDLVDILVKSSLEGVKNPSTKENVKLTEKQVVDNLKLVIFAGHDTTAISLAWGIYLLAKHQSVIEDLRKEIEEFGEPGRVMESVIIEILRMYPPGMFFKEPVEDIKLGKYLIPKGSEIMLNPFIIQRDDRYYNKPNEFKPSRWDHYLQGNKSLATVIFQISKEKAFFPFSLGARNCVGRNLALIEMKLVLQNIVQNFDISLPPTMPLEFQEFPYMSLTMVPKGCNICFTARKLKL